MALHSFLLFNIFEFSWILGKGIAVVFRCLIYGLHFKVFSSYELVAT